MRKLVTFLLRSYLLSLNTLLILLCLFSNSTTFAQVIVINPIPVIKAPSTTTITSSANPSTAGQPVLLTATVTSPAQGVPTGTVHFFDNANTDLTPNGVALTNGKADFTTAILTANANFTATYSGDDVNLPGTSAAFTQVVNSPPIIISVDPAFYLTTTTLVSSTNPSVAGSQPVTFTATVSSTGNADLTGKVHFYDNTNNQDLTPSGVSLVNGVATFTTSSLPFGDLNITATYSGDTNGNQQSTSNSIIQRVQLTITGIDITLAGDFSKATTGLTSGTVNWGDRVTFTATASTGLGAPAGIVSFFDYGNLISSAKIDNAGNATFSTSILSSGTHSITAGYLSKTSNAVVVTINPPFPFISFGSPGTGATGTAIDFIVDNGYNVISDDQKLFYTGPDVPYGKPVTFSAYIGRYDGFQYVPSGNVKFKVVENGVEYLLGEVGLDATGHAFFTTSILKVGGNRIKAEYGGNDVYFPASFSRFMTVVKSSTTTKTSSNLNPSIAGQQITFTAAVPFPIFDGSNALAPGGDVVFNIDGVDQSPSPLTGNGVKAFLDISSLSPGNHAVKAKYLGDANYNGSTSAPLTQVVEPVGSGIFYFLGNEQSTQINTAFPNGLMFNILNINQKLVGGATVIYTAPASGASGTFSNGTNSITIKTTPLGSFGVASSGLFTANGIAGTYTVTATIPGLGTAAFTMTNTAPPVQVSIGTSVDGLSYAIDGFSFTSTKSFNLQSGNNYTISTTSPQTSGTGIEYTFTGWSDGNSSLFRTITGPASPASYIAQFSCEKQWVLDKDLDSYYTGEPVVACQSPGGGYVLKGDLKPSDCDDNNPAINPATLWYLDNDNDGYSNNLYIPAPGGSCTPPQDGRNYILNPKGQDCNDNDATYNPETVWVKDGDRDGYYTGEPYTGCFFIFPEGYVRKTTQEPGDCDDGNASINPATVWYKDADNDGYSDGTSQVSCVRPTNYKLSSELTEINGDCNDADGTLNPATVWYADLDDDNYTSGQTKQQCQRPQGYKLQQELASTATDCNDRDKTVYTQYSFYVDADGDGYGTGSARSVCAVNASTPPLGYSLTNTDCDDSNIALWRTGTFYEDADGDGFTVGTGEQLCYGTGTPNGYRTARSSVDDCNDNLNTVGAPVNWYLDKDNDEYYTGNVINACTSPGTGYKASGLLGGGDCNDADASINPNTVWYLDADGDGYAASTVKQCAKPVGNYTKTVIPVGDCNDADNTVHAVQIYYKDADGDGYGGSISVTVCSIIPPPGYSTKGGDLYDNDPTANPGAVEVCGNRKDDNCNGKIDEQPCYSCGNATGSSTEVGCTNATLKWVSIPNAVAWQVQYKGIRPGDKWTDVLINGQNPTGNLRSVLLTGLKTNQNYLWHIRALCGNAWTTYSVSIAFKTSCASAATTTRVNSNVDGLQEVGRPSLQLYPNPSNGQFLVSLSTGDKQNAEAKISLLDASGRTVINNNAVLSNGVLQKTIRVPATAAQGLYLVQVFVNGKVYWDRLIYTK